ncbi:DUF7334 family protein [Salmonella enterica]|uniref:DUF7334 family protein n=1 Tax=Salmonella enterica TaxID=28901 RepID=UPI003B5865CB
MILSACVLRGIMLMQTTKQKVWEAAKNEGVDRFISMIAKYFPGAIDVVHIKSPHCDVWCKAK